MLSLKSKFQAVWFREKPDQLNTNQIYINERAIRARAGIILLIPIILLFIRLDHADHNEWIISPTATISQEQVDTVHVPVIQREYSHTFAYSIIFFVMYEMLMAMFVRTSHFSITSLLGAFITSRQKPNYQPMRPKIFAWLIGLVLAVLCQISLYYTVMQSIAFYFLAACLLFMWLEAVCGICAGCHIHGWLTKVGIIKEPCEPCENQK